MYYISQNLALIKERCLRELYWKIIEYGRKDGDVKLNCFENWHTVENRKVFIYFNVLVQWMHLLTLKLHVYYL